MEGLFYPESVAVLGASTKPGKIGYALFKNLVEGGFRGRVYPVNVKGGAIDGRRVYRSLSELPEVPDLLIVAIPARAVPGALEEAGRLGIRRAIVISAGFSEVGEEGRRLEEELVRVARRHNILLVGPNCLGIYNSENKLCSIFNPMDRQRFPGPGSIALLSQSGALGAAMLDWMADMGLGMSKFVSYGNAALLEERHFVEYLAQDPKTRVIALYIEGVKDGKAFMETARKVAARKPILVIKAGRSSEGAAAASSHTGSMAGSFEVYEGAFRQSGILYTRSLREFFVMAKALSMLEPPSGPRVGIVTNGGGMGVLTTDAVIEGGLEIARFSEGTVEEFERLVRAGKLPEHGAYNNPVDILGDARPETYEEAMRVVLSDPGVDMVVLIVIAVAPTLRPDLPQRLSHLVGKKPVVGIIPGSDFAKSMARGLEDMGIPVYETPEEAVVALRALYDYGRIRKKLSSGTGP
ncbi:MAG: CoA-binding protein [Thermoplasmata archaeon]|nr:MAG: CoA-binding protein [Thermoplasmata archaeon]HDJ26982.1 CoA-binding protein [Aciduliprofundum sp.]